MSLSSFKIVPGALQDNVTGLTKAKVKDSEISDIHISPNSITTAKIQNNAVSSAKLRDQALKTRHFSDNSVNNDSIVDAEITNDDIAEGTLLNAKFSTNTITNNRFADNSIDAVKLSSNSFSNASIADAEISTAKFKNNGILEEDIADGAITSNKINDGIITSAVMVSEALTSRVLAQNSLINDDFGNNEIYSEHFQNSTIKSEKIALDTIVTNNLDDLAVSGSKLFKVDDDTTLLLRSDSANNSTNMTEVSKNQRTVTRQGNTKHSTTEKKFGATSIYFDGDGDYLELDDSDDWPSGSGNFTIEYWVFQENGNNQTYNDHVSQNTDSNNWWGSYIKDQNSLKFRLNVTNSSPAIELETTSFTSGQWNHVAISKSSTTYRLFLNGQIVDSTTYTTDFPNFTSNLYIGHDPIENSFNQGYLDEIRLSKVARYTSNFTPPDAPFENIQGKKIKDATLTNAQLLGSFDETYIKDGTVASSKLAANSLTSVHIINNTINGSQFSDATIDGSVLESKTLIQSDIANDAVVAGKFSNSINIDGKTSSSANIARAKLIDDAVTAEKLSFVFDADDTSKIASDAVTDGKLASNQLFDTTKVQDGSIKLDKIATGQLSSFASNTLTAADFDKDSSSDNIKIGRKQIKAGNKIKAKQITTAKIKTDSALPNASLSDSSIENSDFADDSISSGDIEDGTITSKQLADTDFGSSRLPEFNGNKFEALSSAQIENNIFDADDFPNQYFQSHHIASMDAAKLETDAITGDKVKDGVITASKFSTGILTDGSIVANSITSDKIKNGTLQAAHLKSNAITGAKFKDDTLTAADFDTSNTDGIFSDGIIATSIHQHNPYNFQRVETNTDFTLLQSSSRGRANFSYRIKDSQTLTDAQQTCKNENSQLCDINQLIDICRNSAGVDDAFYFAGEPVLISEKTKDYFVFPMLKDSNNDCFDPEITYDVYAEEPVPVKVNFLYRFLWCT